ncbi:MAG: hypothetical protein OQJ99_00075 [Rhodospirillales bacterium]|nr:hypothetical protein [Rhodospirillales bacterium]MCW8970617.1 hypothetical protein [Rhodospirillales bacterium]
MKSLRLLAGDTAIGSIRANGLHPDRIKVMPGAAGGPKWLVLGRMDQVIFGEWFRERTTPVDIIGASSGAWRFAAAAQADPIRAQKRLEDIYIETRFEEVTSPRRVREDCETMIAGILGENGAAEILSNPKVRLHLMAARSSALTSGEGKLMLGLPSGLAFLANAIHRPALSLFFTRALFSDPRAGDRFPGLGDLPTLRNSLNAENMAPVLMASGAIPVVTEGVRDIPGAPKGTYRDGGVTDYHFASPLLSAKDEADDGIVFYPHYSDQIIPGWLDKHLPWRRAKRTATERMVLLTPSPRFVASLPGGRIPMRQDFMSMNDGDRITYWRKAADESERLADELREIIASNSWLDLLEPIEKD